MRASSQTGWPYWIGLVLVLGLLAVAVLQIDHSETTRLRHQETDRMRRDLWSIHQLIHDAVQQRNDEEITQILSRWGQADEAIVELRLVAGNGRLLGHYLRERPALHSLHLSDSIHPDLNGLVIVHLTRDIAALVSATRQQRLETGILAAGLALSFILLAWAGALGHRYRLERRQREAGQARLAAELEETAGTAGRLRAWLDGVLDSLPALLIGVDAEGRINEWSGQAERSTHIKREDALGLPLPELMPHLNDQMDRMREAIADGRPVRTTRLTTVTGGTVRYSDVMVNPLGREAGGGALIRVEDMTQWVRFEQMMVQSEKMVSLGGLAAGVAHELNSPLSGVLQNTQNVLRRLSPELPANIRAAAQAGVDLKRLQDYLYRRKIREFLNLARESAERASQILTDMLAFSRRGPDGLEKMAVEDLLETTLRLASNDFDLKKKLEFRKVEVIRDYADGLPLVHCERTRMEQVLLNLIKNAAQAMSQANTPAPRRIILRTREAGQQLLIEVEDNGPGMSKEVQARVFEPFFTTRGAGQGTGLGLAVADFIVTDQHEGGIEVSSTPGRGSLFRIRLPLGSEQANGTGGGFSHSRRNGRGS